MIVDGRENFFQVNAVIFLKFVLQLVKFFFNPVVGFIGILINFPCKLA